MSKPVPTYGKMWPIYAGYWDAMKASHGREEEIKRVARQLLDHKDRYVDAELMTSVPWYMIAVLHWRESSANFNRQLAQGDPLHKKSVNVPKGRGPFATWEDSAYDALVSLKGLNKIVDWRLEKILYQCERYNGWGYFQYRNVPSPYLWGATTIQMPGKYVADGKWDKSAWDKQLGCAALLEAMRRGDHSIKFVREE